ncbi:MAG: hypothetical protein ACRDKG_05200 [Actinomycetota bacterium]
MRELLGPYRASLSLGRRRSIALILLLLIAIAGAISWTSYRPVRQQRGFLEVLESGNITADNFFQFAPGISCTGGDFGSGFGPKPAPGTETPTPSTGEPTPEPIEPECQFIGNDGQPIGKPFRGDPFGPGGFSPELLDEIRPELIAGQKELIARMERDLAPMRVLESRIRMLGTFLGIGFVVLLGATFFGAEFRWGVWPTLLTHEPRRGRVLGAKLAALWTLVAIGFLLSLAVGGGVDVVMRELDGVTAAGGPSVGRLAEQAAWAVLSLELYTTIAAALALLVRTSIAGVAALLVALGDHLIVGKYEWLRHYFPTQQVASLLPQPTGVASGHAWFGPITAGIRCKQVPGQLFEECTEVLFKPPPHWRASLVLVAWTLGFAMLAWVALRGRDVPQS